ncbi:MAG: hypothetical protein ACRC2K_00120, partial [Clostridium sp.]
MKYKTFNDSCSFCGVANLLEDFGIDTEDYIIAKESLCPYIFKNKDNTFFTGAWIQGDKYFS